MCMHSPKGRNTTVIVWKAVSFHVFFGRTWCKGILKNLHQSLDFGQVTNLSSGHFVARCFMSGHSYLKKIQVQDFCGSRLEIPHDAGEFHPANMMLNVPAIDDKNFWNNVTTMLFFQKIRLLTKICMTCWFIQIPAIRSPEIWKDIPGKPNSWNTIGHDLIWFLMALHV